jgi:hypothetical protein
MHIDLRFLIVLGLFILFGNSTGALAQTDDCYWSNLSGQGNKGCRVTISAGTTIEFRCDGCSPVGSNGASLELLDDSLENILWRSSRNSDRYTVSLTGNYVLFGNYSFSGGQSCTPDREEIVGENCNADRSVCEPVTSIIPGTCNDAAGNGSIQLYIWGLAENGGTWLDIPSGTNPYITGGNSQGLLLAPSNQLSEFDRMSTESAEIRVEMSTMSAQGLNPLLSSSYDTATPVTAVRTPIPPTRVASAASSGNNTVSSNTPRLAESSSIRLEWVIAGVVLIAVMAGGVVFLRRRK